MALITFNKIHISFILDWLFILVVGIFTLFLNIISPFERQFSLDDETISHPYSEHETFTVIGLAFSVVGFPVVVMTLYHVYKRELKFSFHQTIMGYCVSIVLALFVTSIIKVSVGRYRPDFLSRCKVNLTKVEEIYKSYNISNQVDFGPRNLYNTSICSNPDKSIVDEGRRSFPSGHTSFAFSSLTYTSFFLAGKLHLYDGNFLFWKLLIFLVPNLFAMYIAITRISDYRHHWQDVIVGAVIGILFSVMSYYYYFPLLNSAEPYKPLQGRFRNFSLFQEHSGKTLPVYRDKDSEGYIRLKLLDEEEPKQNK